MCFIGWFVVLNALLGSVKCAGLCNNPRSIVVCVVLWVFVWWCIVVVRPPHSFTGSAYCVRNWCVLVLCLKLRYLVSYLRLVYLALYLKLVCLTFYLKLIVFIFASNPKFIYFIFHTPNLKLVCLVFWLWLILFLLLQSEVYRIAYPVWNRQAVGSTPTRLTSLIKPAV